MTGVPAANGAHPPVPNVNGAPPALQARVDAALRSAAAGETGESMNAVERCLAAGEALLTRLLHADCHARDVALDLLAADALVTHAFELAADDPERIEERAGEAMRRIAALATVHG